MNWNEVCNNPHLHNLPFKIETNEDGNIVMSPVKVHHAVLQGKIVRLLSQCLPERLSKNPELIFKQNSLGARASSLLEEPKAGWKPAHPAKNSTTMH